MKNLDYIKKLVYRIEEELNSMDKTTDPDAISKSERVLVQFVRELQLASPRVWEDIIAKSQSRREEIKEQ